MLPLFHPEQNNSLPNLPRTRIAESAVLITNHFMAIVIEKTPLVNFRDLSVTRTFLLYTSMLHLPIFQRTINVGSSLVHPENGLDLAAGGGTFGELLTIPDFQICSQFTSSRTFKYDRVTWSKAETA